MWSELSRSAMPPALKPNEVQCWLAWLDCSDASAAYFETVLSPDEKVRAGRFFFERDRRHFCSGRALLRILLGAYLGIAPAELGFNYGIHGKPALQASQAAAEIEFNLSHAHGLGVFAFSLGQPLGVDVERVRPMPDEDALAQQFFAPSEIDWLAAHGRPEKQNGFFKIWTAKEAFYKASGDGLTVPISQAVIELDASPPVRLSAIAGDQTQAEQWQIISFEPVPGYQAALALHAVGWKTAFGWLPPEHSNPGGTNEPEE